MQPFPFRNRGVRLAVVVALLVVSAAGSAVAQAPPTKLRTKWAADVTPSRVLPEYPRPDMVRGAWQNLNGSWDYAVTDAAAPKPATFTGKILVPFPIQSQLSGVAVPVTDQQRLWYRRTFRVSALARGSRMLLHFGAVDWESQVFVNTKEVGHHTGGYDPFTFDITSALKPAGDQELVVSVWDPTDKGPQPRGKQVLEPKSIWYTAVTGIWQTVWAETVPDSYINALEIGSDAGTGTITVTARSNSGGPGDVRVTVLDAGKPVVAGTGSAGQPIAIRVPQPKLWSPDQPFLYDLRVNLGRDEVKSYAGIRTIAVQRFVHFLRRQEQIGFAVVGHQEAVAVGMALHRACDKIEFRNEAELALAIGHQLAVALHRRKSRGKGVARGVFHAQRGGEIVGAHRRAAFAQKFENAVAGRNVDVVAALPRRTRQLASAVIF